MTPKMMPKTELDGYREGVGHYRGNGLTGEGFTEIAHKDAFDVKQVLDDERFIQVVFRFDTCTRGFGQPAVAAERLYGVTRHKEDEGVEQQGGPEEHGDHLEQPPPYITQHGSGLSFST